MSSKYYNNVLIMTFYRRFATVHREMLEDIVGL